MGLFDTLSGLAVRRLPRERVLALRAGYHAFRVKLYPLLRRVHGTFGSDELRDHLEQTIGRDFEILMVHSSLNHMLPTYTGDALELVQMLKDYCGPERTLAMPAFYLGDPLLDDVVESYRRNPLFDVRRTPSQMGVVSELFRRSRGVLQSLHPTHRVAALGPLAETLTTGHERASTPCGKGTPFEVMARHDALVLGIGKFSEVLSQVHHVEDVLGADFPVPAAALSVPICLRGTDGREQSIELHWRKFKWPRDMSKLRALMSPSSLREWRFHNVPLFAARAREVTETLTSAALRGETLYDRR
jgi:aminoglycoside 3-N-acetyltransferase